MPQSGNDPFDFGEHLVADRLTVLIADALKPIHAEQRDTEGVSASFDTGPFPDERLPSCVSIEHSSPNHWLGRRCVG